MKNSKKHTAVCAANGGFSRAFFSFPIAVFARERVARIMRRRVKDLILQRNWVKIPYKIRGKGKNLLLIEKGEV